MQPVATCCSPFASVFQSSFPAVQSVPHTFASVLKSLVCAVLAHDLNCGDVVGVVVPVAHAVVVVVLGVVVVVVSQYQRYFPIPMLSVCALCVCCIAMWLLYMYHDTSDMHAQCVSPS